MISNTYEGSESDVRQFLAQTTHTAYVYVLQRPDGTPFYVGKGKNQRIFEHVMEARLRHRTLEANPYKCNVIRKLEAMGGEVRYRIDSLHLDEVSALKREGELIRHIGRLHEGGPLTNLAGGTDNPGSPSPHSTEKHAKSLSGEADDPDTRTLNRFFQSIQAVKSVPIKPLKRFHSRLRHTTMQTKPDAFSCRNAGAIIASALCHGIALVPGAHIPRRFTYNGIEAVIENGVCENITGRGIARITVVKDPGDECIVLGPDAPQLIIKLIGLAKLNKMGVILRTN